MRKMMLLLLLLPAVAAFAEDAPPNATLALLEPRAYQLQTRDFVLLEDASLQLDCVAIRQKFSDRSHTGAWLVDLETDREVWRSRPADGELLPDSRILYRIETKLDLPAGRYALHQFGGGGWFAKAPFQDLSGVLNDLADMLNREDPGKDPDSFQGRCFVSLMETSGRDVFGTLDGEDHVDGCLIDLRRAGDGQLKTQSFRVEQRVDCRLTATAEWSGKGDGFFDYGWLSRAGGGKTIWRVEDRYCIPAGGAEKNRICSRPLTLEPGLYTVGYVTDDSHSWESWNAMPPTRPERWGLCLDVSDEHSDAIRLIDDADAKDPDVLVSFLYVGDDETRRDEFILREKTKLAIFAIGEGRRKGMYDYGRIVSAESGREVWAMDFDNCRHAGGTDRNLLFDGSITLPAGLYRAIYETDDSHAFGDWNSPAPDEPFRYGMVIRRR